MKLIFIILLFFTLKGFGQTTKATVLELELPLDGLQKGNNFDSGRLRFKYSRKYFGLDENGEFIPLNTSKDTVYAIIRDTVYIYTGESHPGRQSATAPATGEFIIPFDQKRGIPDDYSHYQIIRYSKPTKTYPEGKFMNLLWPGTEYKKINGQLVVFKVTKGHRILYWRLK